MCNYSGTFQGVYSARFLREQERLCTLTLTCGVTPILHLWSLQVAMEMECYRMQWQVLDWNTDAVRLYQRLNATPSGDLINYRLSGEKLERLASGK